MATFRPVMIRIQPLPTLTILGRLNDVTAITRRWADGDPQRCTLCDECTASDEGTCTVLTEEVVSERAAPLYSSRGLRGDGETTLAPTAFGF